MKIDATSIVLLDQVFATNEQRPSKIEPGTIAKNGAPKTKRIERISGGVAAGQAAADL